MAWEPHINSSFQVGIIILCVVLAPVAPILVGLRLWSKSILRSCLKWGDYLVIGSCYSQVELANWELKDRPMGFWVMRVELGVGIQDVLFVLADQGPDAVEEGPKWVVYGVLPDVLSCVCDVIIFALPLKSLWSLQMQNRKHKIRLMFTFTIGFIACVLSLLRILAWKLPGFIRQAPSDIYIRRDAFEVLYPIEITFGILGACLPMLRPLFHRKEYSRSSRNSYAMGPVRDAGSRTALTSVSG
ncbi:hypothetical protein DHEL01_v212760 [Diaporthe helianthi]|uniref:Rhodopsin domain-containing protein n=1 Tax=Diaporthe helianthi TaxID=158607 RepID=A0A2P5HF08_DIAHE|nr:hypothetical protein DHEL01_v212760 [Diaporthe helianthi]